MSPIILLNTLEKLLISTAKRDMNNQKHFLNELKRVYFKKGVE